MTEREKMLAGELYLASDPELVALRQRARRLTRLYNETTEEEIARRAELLGELFGRLGPRATIEPPFRCDYGANIAAGSDLYMNFGCIVLDCAEVILGNSVQCGPSVQILTATHPLDAALRAVGPELARPIRIGNRVWLGGGAIICPGVTIGDDTVVGAGSVVTKSLPAGVVAVGNPARVIRTPIGRPSFARAMRGSHGGGIVRSMSVALNHTIVHARDAKESATFFSEILGLPAPTPFGHFLAVRLDHGLTFDFVTSPGEFTPQHYAFLVTEEEFDKIYGRIRERGIEHYPEPNRKRVNEINHNDGGRGVYWCDPGGHFLEILTVPYGGWPK